MARRDASDFFSIPSDLVPVGKPMPYDLYINSSALDVQVRFVRVYPQGQVLTIKDLHEFERKYRRLYVSESQRATYLQALCASSGRGVAEKATVLKESAVRYLSVLFDSETPPTAEVISRTVLDCRELVGNFVDVLKEQDVSKLRDLIASLSFHDFYTFDHSIDVAMYSILICRDLNPKATNEELVTAGLGGLLHDIGKIRIPTRILNFTGKLTGEDLEEIHKHPDYGREMLKSHDLLLPPASGVELVTRVVNEHHENFDGTGYPRKLQGQTIHQLARIVAVADFYDAVTTKRSYQDPLSSEDALALMLRSAGKKLDPKVFQAFAKRTLGTDKIKSANFEMRHDFDCCKPHANLKDGVRAAREKR